MKIQYASDLHLEFLHNAAYLKENPIPAVGDILILAGDIVPFRQIVGQVQETKKHQWFFDQISDQFEQVFWIPGNHEYYHADVAERSSSFREKIRNNVLLANNVVEELGNVRLLLSTLWGQINPANHWVIQQNMSDFHVIQFHGSRFSCDHFNQLHQQAINFLTTHLQNKQEGTTIVVTHHVPTLMHYPEQYKNSPLNQAFATELFDFIASANIDYWIYGHHHQNTPDFKIGNTMLCTNQLGYVHLREELGFEHGKILNL